MTHSIAELAQEFELAPGTVYGVLNDLGIEHDGASFEADEDTLAILREGEGRLRGVLHCFTGTAALRDAGLALGFYISLAGILTFPKAADLRETARAVPLDRLLTETDSPFLAPVPHRGKRNEPAYVARVVEELAALHQEPASEVARRTASNFHTLFAP